jgi:TolB-like protein
MSDVFISYARSTARLAGEVAAALSARGYGVWKDSEIPAHRSFADEIEQRIAAAKAVVVVWSADAVRSDWVRSEADRARQDAKIVQLCIDRTRLPMPFDQIECADLGAWTGDLTDPEWRKVEASIAHLVGRRAEIGRRPAIAKPDRPSIAAMPFKNITPGRNAEYLADAITEDIITALSRQHLFFVIASGTAFSYKSRDVELEEVGRELGVRYVLSGSIRKSGRRVRVTAQLADVGEGANLWADSFDRELTDILALQDEITERVVTAIEPALLHSEGKRAQRKSLKDFSALDCFYRGMWHLNRVSTEGYAEALRLFTEAVRLDPELSLGHVGLSRILFGGAIFGWSQTPIDDLKRAREAARAAVRLDPRDAYAYFALSGPSLYLGDHGAALHESARAVDLNVNCAPAFIRRGTVLTFSGRPVEAIEPLERGLRLSPYDSQLAVMLESLALAHYLAGHYERAAECARDAMHQTGGATNSLLAASLAQLGRLDEAKAALPADRWPGASFQRPMAAPYAVPSDVAHLREGIRKARAA